jgi:hypothetical protein
MAMVTAIPVAATVYVRGTIRMRSAYKLKRQRLAHKARLKRIPALAAKFLAWRDKVGASNA